MAKKLYKKTNPRKIKARMILMGVKQVDIARALNVTPGAVRKVINGEPISHRIRAELARRLDTTPDKIWRRI